MRAVALGNDTVALCVPVTGSVPVVTGVAQGIFAGIGYAIFGVPEAAFFGAATVIASLLPGIGTLLVWVPVGVYLMATGLEIFCERYRQMILDRNSNSIFGRYVQQRWQE